MTAEEKAKELISKSGAIKANEVVDYYVSRYEFVTKPLNSESQYHKYYKAQLEFWQEVKQHLK